MDNKTIPEGIQVENVGKLSTNFYWTYNYNGQVFNFQTTVRDVQEFEKMQAHIKSVLEISAHVTDLGGVAKQVGSSAYQETKSNAATIPTVPSMNDLNAQMEQAEKHAEVHEQPKQGALTFETTHLVCEIRDGKQYFKVKGPFPFQKFGVTCWPEVLTGAGIPVAKLEGKEYTLTGYIAEYVLNKEGKPSKVVKLEKVAP